VEVVATLGADVVREVVPFVPVGLTVGDGDVGGAVAVVCARMGATNAKTETRSMRNEMRDGMVALFSFCCKTRGELK